MYERRDFLKAIAASVVAAGCPLPAGLAKPTEWVGELRVIKPDWHLWRIVFTDDVALAAAKAEGSELAEDAVVGEWKYLSVPSDPA